MKKILITCIAAAFLAGCRVDEQDLNRAKQSPLQVSRCAYAICSNEIPYALHSEIISWLMENRNKWKFDLNTFAPETVVENDFIQLNIQKSRLILSIKKDGGWPQYSRAIEPVHLKWKNEIEKMNESGNEKAGTINR